MNKKYVVKQYSQHDPDFVVYKSKPMGEEAAQEHLRQMKATDLSKGFMQNAKSTVEPHTPPKAGERLSFDK